MKKQNAEALQWFVDFANLDLESIKPGDKAKLLVEAKERLWPVEEMEEFQRGLSYEWGIGTTCMRWAVNLPSEGSQEYWSAIVQSQRGVLQIFRLYFLHPPTAHDPLVSEGHHEMAWRVEGGGKSPFGMKILPLTDAQDEYLEFKLFMLLEGFQAHAIRLCPGCKNFFLNLTNREKRFCGSRCMWRITTAERREADREGYNEYQKELMKDRYREKKGLPRRKTHPKKGEA